MILVIAMDKRIIRKAVERMKSGVPCARVARELGISYGKCRELAIANGIVLRDKA